MTFWMLMMGQLFWLHCLYMQSDGECDFENGFDVHMYGEVNPVRSISFTFCLRFLSLRSQLTQRVVSGVM